MLGKLKNNIKFKNSKKTTISKDPNILDLEKELSDKIGLGHQLNRALLDHISTTLISTN